VVDAAEAGAPLPPAIVEKARYVQDIHKAAFRKAVEAGVRIAMGTDSGVTPHGRNLRELELMVAGGMSPAAALEATTRSAAELMGVDADLGTIEEDKLADLVAVEGDAYTFGDFADRVAGVWKAGRQVVGEPFEGGET
jgi:imidazolonepropionase-like amidohydrolase